MVIASLYTLKDLDDTMGRHALHASVTSDFCGSSKRHMMITLANSPCRGLQEVMVVGRAPTKTARVEAACGHAHHRLHDPQTRES
eukprot:scaffold261719_cov28-Tisochrysis_lutea.AAC.1